MIQNNELREIQEYVLGGDLDLNSLPYWPFKYSLPICTKKKGLIPTGTFYVPFNTINKYEHVILKRTIKTIKDDEIIFIPNIRKSDTVSIEPLKTCGFCLVEIDGESIVHYLGVGGDEYLRKQIGSKTFRDHKRIVRKSEAYFLKIYNLEDILNSSFLFDSWVQLFVVHEKKYNNTTIVYGADFLNKLSLFKIKDEFRFNFRFSGEKVIQVYLTRLADDTLYLISSASSSDNVGVGVNLYTTMMIESFQIKDKLGFKFLNLGRGAKNIKVKYGANIYIPHVHALYTRNHEALNEIINWMYC